MRPEANCLHTVEVIRQNLRRQGMCDRSLDVSGSGSEFELRTVK